jgi:glycosyltransferase involved in cell wall biosynthesis
LFVAEPLAHDALIATAEPSDRRRVLFGWSRLSHVPAAARRTLLRMHAILAPNAFAAAAFRAAGHRNVAYVPFVPIVPDDGEDGTPAAREGIFTFASELDGSSSLERQNVNYLLNAFVRAFAGRRDVVLDVAVRGPAAGLPFDAIMAAHPNVRFGAGGGAADAFVSLDRADAMGLGLYAAMARGLPVVAPAYAAAADVLDETTGIPVWFGHVAVPDSDPTFALTGEAAPLWADPAISAAAAAMRTLVEDPARGRRLGAAARERIAARRALFLEGAWLRELLPRRTYPRALVEPRRVSVAFEGEFRSPLSLAHINRELALRFARDPAFEVFAVDRVEQPDPTIELAPELLPCLRTTAEAAQLCRDVHVGLYWPPLLDRRPSHRYVAFLPWELSELPAAWRDAIDLGIDAVWTLSRHSRDAFIRAGIAEEKVALLPLGIDPALLRPDGPRLDVPARTLRFLYVGGTVGRKGFDFVDRAYFRTFGPADDVSLVIKDVGTDSVYKDGNAATYLRGLATNRNAAHLVYLDRTLSDADIAALYRSCDVLVAPYRAEGFGLPILEAMACGLPVIVTAGGASDDFVDDACGLRIPSVRVASPPDVGLALVRDAWVLEPDLELVRDAMRTLAGDAALRHRLGEAAAARAATWTWDRSAALAREAIAALLAT